MRNVHTQKGALGVGEVTSNNANVHGMVCEHCYFHLSPCLDVTISPVMYIFLGHHPIFFFGYGQKYA